VRTLDQIVESVMKGERPEYEELRYALLAYQSLSTFDRMALMKLAEAEREGKRPFLTRSAVFQAEEHFNRMKFALAKSPKEWVGWNNDPDNPEYQKRRAIALKLVDKVMNQSLQSGRKP
jgi:hypothetical protein